MPKHRNHTHIWRCPGTLQKKSDDCRHHETKFLHQGEFSGSHHSSNVAGSCTSPGFTPAGATPVVTDGSALLQGTEL